VHAASILFGYVFEFINIVNRGRIKITGSVANFKNGFPSKAFINLGSLEFCVLSHVSWSCGILPSALI